MRIAIYNTFSRYAGGIESYLGRVIPALRQAGHDLATMFELDAPAGHPSLPFPKQTWCTSEIGTASALEKMRAWRPDVIYTHGITDWSLERALIETAPAVHFAHDYTAICVSGSKTFSFPYSTSCSCRLGLHCIVNYFPRRCGGMSPITMWQNYLTGRHRIEIMLGYRNILVASAAMRSEFLCNGIEPDRLKVVRYPVSAPSAQTLPSTKPESQGGSGSGQFCSGQLRHLFFAGRMVALKGGEILLNALPRVATELDCSLTLTLAGDGPARPQWEAQARSVCEKQPSITVEFAGWLNATEMDRSLAGADLLVVPSLWPEPFGLIGPEAGMHGVPAAAFATGGISEWLHEGSNGFLAPANPPTADGLAAAIAMCLNDPYRYRQLRLGARVEALKFGLEQHVDSLLQILTAAAGEAPACTTERSQQTFSQ